MAGVETIYATSSGASPAAIAIVRVSGPASFAICQAMARTVPEPRRATLRALRHPGDGSVLDRALILTFPAPRTATGEDVIEFHVHGGRAVIVAVEAAIGSWPCTRRAEPGEFTRRALENGVIDLTAAEGLGDLLSAQTETQRRAALRMAEGGVRALIEGWTDRLIRLAAEVEAQLDFSDADDVAPGDVTATLAELWVITEEIAAILAHPPVERLHDGIRIVIAGPPNSGKSTLLNAMANRDVAIVSSISGTTRDRLEAPVVRDGIAYVLTDTAGLTDNPGDEIEAIGINRAKAAIETADIVIWLGDTEPMDPSHLAIHARADQPSRFPVPGLVRLGVSARTGLGMASLWSLIAARAGQLLPTEDTIAVNARHRRLLAQCHINLTEATGTADMLIVAESIRRALRTLDAIVGRAGIENVLDDVFSRFCIGK